MVAGRTYQITAVILKRYNIGETDKLVTIFSRQQGKKTVLARGIRKLHSKKAPHLELFSHASLHIHKGRNLDLVTEAQTIELFRNLRSRLEGVAYAYKIVEVVDRLCALDESHPGIFDKLLAILRLLDSGQSNSIPNAVDKFNTELLWELGFLPKDKVIPSDRLTKFLEGVMERELKSDNFLTRLSATL